MLGEFGSYGKNLPDGMKNISISNVICNRPSVIHINGYLCDSVISNITSRRYNCPAVVVGRKDGIKNVKMSNLNAVGTESYKAEQ